MGVFCLNHCNLEILIYNLNRLLSLYIFIKMLAYANNKEGKN